MSPRAWFSALLLTAVLGLYGWTVLWVTGVLAW